MIFTLQRRIEDRFAMERVPSRSTGGPSIETDWISVGKTKSEKDGEALILRFGNCVWERDVDPLLAKTGIVQLE